MILMESTKETAIFCSKQIECILRFVQQVYPNYKLEHSLSLASVMLDELGKTGKIKKEGSE